MDFSEIWNYSNMKTKELNSTRDTLNIKITGGRLVKTKGQTPTNRVDDTND